MTLLHVQSLTKKFDQTTAVHQAAFTLRKNKCIALLGPNGAGKTTILRVLAGLLKPTSGKVLLTGQPESTDIRKFIGYLPQHPVFPGWMTGKEFLLFSGTLSLLDKQTAKNLTVEFAARLGITDALNKRISSYSGGMKQRLGIAQAMIHSPQLLLLDEPVSSLDPIGRREILTLLEELKTDTTILFSTHILNDAEEVSDELILLNHGEIVETGEIIALRKKYPTPVIELEFEGEANTYVEKIEGLTSVTGVSLVRNSLKVASEDIKKSREVILHLAAAEQWPLVSFNINRASLEDMFIKAVNQ